MKKIELKILKMHCTACAVGVEAGLKAKTGVIKANVNYASEKARLEYDEKKINRTEIEKEIERLGYKTGTETEAEDEMIVMKKRVMATIILGLFLFYVSMIKMMGFWPQLILSTAIMALNKGMIINGIKQICRLKPNMDSLVGLGVLAAWGYSLFGHELYFESAGFILVFITIGKYLEMATKGKSREAVRKLLRLEPKMATVIKKGKEVVIEAGQVEKGEILVVKPGESVAVDGIVIEGESSVDEKMITGESVPVLKKKGDGLIGGTINIDGNLQFRATGVGKEMMLSKIVVMVEEAMESKAPIQALADKISLYFVPIVVGVAMVSLISWLVLTGDMGLAVKAMVAVLIISCPCALGLATPTAVMAGTGLAANLGILIKNGETLQKAEKVEVVIFDKTGTLTTGRIKVIDFLNNETLILAASLEIKSEHPIAKAIVKKSKEMKLKLLPVTGFKNKPGMGVVGKIKNKKVTIGTKRLMEKEKIKLGNYKKEIEEVRKRGQSVIIVARANKVIGFVVVADEIKTNGDMIIKKLKDEGKKTIMITGDSKQVARAVGKQIKVDKIMAEVLPTKKAKEVKKLKDEGVIVAMVGDGVNDAPALAEADVGIVMGSGTEVAIETGEIVLLKNNLEGVIMAIDLSVFTMKKIKQNLFWAFFYNIIAIPVAAGVLYPLLGWTLNPSIAAAAMAFSSVSVVLNSVSMKFKKFD